MTGSRHLLDWIFQNIADQWSVGHQGNVAETENGLVSNCSIVINCLSCSRTLPWSKISSHIWIAASDIHPCVPSTSHWRQYNVFVLFQQWLTAVTFPAAEHHRPLASTKLYCSVTEAHGCEQLAKGCYAALPRVGFEPTTCWSRVQRSTCCATMPPVRK